MSNIIDVSNYFVKKGLDDNIVMTPLKLQKLCYYVKVTAMLKDNKLLNDCEFEAWVHGPVNKKLYNKYLGYYSNTLIRTLDSDFDINVFEKEELDILEEVYKKFGLKTGEELEEITHQEKPWIDARGKLLPYESGNKVIAENTMKEYYSACPI